MKEFEDEVLKKLGINEKDEKSINDFSHSYFQGVIVEIGNIRGLDTYIPPQDKNKLFLEKRLSDLATTTSIFNFTYPQILRKAKTGDTIWFNERKMPCAFYEVEHSTDIRNSLNKFFELQDFRANFYIVAAKERKKQFDDAINASIYASIKNVIRFVDYDALITQYDAEQKIWDRVI